VKKHEPSSAPTGIAYLRGRLEAQAEFAKAIGVLQIELTERMGSILSHPEALRELLGIPDRMPNLRETPAQPHQGKRGPLALADGSRSPAAHGDRGYVGSKLRNNPWARMSAEERSAEMARRIAKRKNKSARDYAALKTITAAQNDTKTADRLAKQRIYVARSVARKLGQPLPPLPVAAAG
jgi:hypothetical protein